MPQPVLQTPSKVIIFVSTLVSSLISVVAGYLLYEKSISVLRDAVEDTSAAVSKSAVIRLSALLDEARATTHEGRLMFERTDILNLSKGNKFVNDVYTAQAFASMRSTPYGYGTGYFLAKHHNESCATCRPPWEDAEGYSRQSVWYDPILDASGNPGKYWLAEHVFGGAEIDGEGTYNETGHEWRKYWVAMNNETGRYAPEVLRSYSIEDVPKIYDWMQAVPEEGAWSPTYLWNAIDGTPYAYNAFRVRHSLVFRDELYDLVLMGFFTFRPWTQVIREFEAAETELVVLDRVKRHVYAHTLYEGPAIKAECNATCFNCADFSGHECLMSVEDLGGTVSGAVNASTRRASGTFFMAGLDGTRLQLHVQYGRYFAEGDVEQQHPLYKKDYHIDTSLGGGEYFVRLSHMYVATETAFELLWLRSVESVNADVYAALVQLIVASAVIFVVDLLIAVAEVVLISWPLEKLVVGNHYLETMELDAAEDHMLAIYKPLMVREVARVTDGMMLAIRGLREYKAYLPNTLFANRSGGEGEGEVERNVTESCSGSLPEVDAASGEAIPNALVTGTSVQRYRGAVIHVQLDRVSYPHFPFAFGMLIEQLQELAQATRGVVHGFNVTDPMCFTVTWNIGCRCPEYARQAAVFGLRVEGNKEIENIAIPCVSVAAGVVQAGNLGSASNRGFGISGEVFEQLQGVTAVAGVMRRHQGGVVLLVTSSISEALMRYEFHALALLQVDAEVPPTLLWQCIREIPPNTEEEWMYYIHGEEERNADPLRKALQTVQGDKKARPRVQLDPDKHTKLQHWGAENLCEGRAVFTYGLHTEASEKRYFC